jgi:hypothetical protein
VQNFGQVKSGPSKIRIVNKSPDGEAIMAEGEIPLLEPFQKSEIELNCGPQFKTGTSRIVEVVIESEGRNPVSLKGSVTLD